MEIVIPNKYLQCPDCVHCHEVKSDLMILGDGYTEGTITCGPADDEDQVWMKGLAAGPGILATRIIFIHRRCPGAAEAW